MLVLTPPDADPLLLTGANDAQLFAYSVRSFQTVSLGHLLSHFVIFSVLFVFSDILRRSLLYLEH